MNLYEQNHINICIQSQNPHNFKWSGAQLSNGTNFNINTSIQITTSRRQQRQQSERDDQETTILTYYDNFAFSFIERYIIYDRIVSKYVHPVQYPNSIITPLGYVACTNALYAIFKKKKYTVLDYASNDSDDVTATGGQMTSLGIDTGPDIYNIFIQMYITLSNHTLVKIHLNLFLIFNYSTLSYDYNGFQVASSNQAIFPGTVLNTQIDKPKQAIIMQTKSQNSRDYYYYDIGNDILGTTNNSNLALFKMIELFDDNQYNTYVLTTTGLILLDIQQFSQSMTFNSMICPLPHNSNYQLTQGMASYNLFDIFYIQNSPYIYKSGPCVGQYILLNQVCVPYDCSDLNCISCPMNNVTCETCISGFVRNEFFICIPDTQTTQNKIMSQEYEILLLVSQILLKTVESIISIPGARALIKPIFYLFGNFDDLYLYQFHDRAYSFVVNDLFDQLNNLEFQKWNIVNSTQIVSHFINVESFNNFINIQQKYQTYNYTENTINTNQSQGLFYNSQGYLITTVPIVLTYFFIFHFIFHISFRYFISKFVRKFYFWIFLSILLFEGNIQQLCFYINREWNSIFAFNFFGKLLKIGIIYYGFTLIFISVAIHYLARYLYKFKASVLIEQTTKNKLGLFLVTFQFGLRNIGLSFLHFYVRMLSYHLLIRCLLISQIFFILFFAAMVIIKVYKKCFKVWIFFMIYMLRLVFIVTLMIDYHNLDLELIYYCQFNIILYMVFLYIIGVVFEIAKTIIKLRQFVIKNIKCPSNKKKTRRKLKLRIKLKVKTNFIIQK